MHHIQNSPKLHPDIIKVVWKTSRLHDLPIKYFVTKETPKQYICVSANNWGSKQPHRISKVSTLHKFFDDEFKALEHLIEYWDESMKKVQQQIDIIVMRRTAVVRRLEALEKC